MLTLAADTPRRSHTVVAVDRAGAEFDTVTVVPSPGVHLRVVRWAAQWTERWWAIEARRAPSRRLEGDPLAAGECVVRRQADDMGGTHMDGSLPLEVSPRLPACLRCSYHLMRLPSP